MTSRDSLPSTGRSAIPLVVLSRLEGTWLDPYDNPPKAAGTAPASLVFDRIPIVLFSSRTRAELEHIQHQLGLSHPFVAENGGAVYFPHRYFGFDVPHARHIAGYQSVAYGKPYPEVVATVRRTAERLGIPIQSFSDMSVEQVADDCGLSLLQARLAKLRDYAEPFRTIESDESQRRQLVKALRAARLECTRDERFEHAGAIVDQGAVVDLILSMYRLALGEIVSVGIGNLEQDMPLLRRVDVPIAQGHAAAPAWAFPTRDVRLNPGGRQARAVHDLIDVIRRAGECMRHSHQPIGSA